MPKRSPFYGVAGDRAAEKCHQPKGKENKNTFLGDENIVSRRDVVF